MPNRDIDDARAALERGDLSRALRKVWNGGRTAYDRGAAEDLETVIELASTLAERAYGRLADEANTTASYYSNCLNDLRAGDRPRSSLERLFGLAGGTQRKKCPDCAESVNREARVCRFCGYRFSEAPTAD